MTDRATDLLLGHEYVGWFEPQMGGGGVRHVSACKLCGKPEASHRPKAAGQRVSDTTRDITLPGRTTAAVCCANTDDDGNCDRHKPLPAAEARPPGCTCGESWPCKLHGGPPEPPAADKALEEKARKLIFGFAGHECGSLTGAPCPTCDYRIPRLTALLRAVAEQARKEAWGESAIEWEARLGEAVEQARRDEAKKSLGEQWDEAVSLGFDAGRREEAAEWERVVRTVRTDARQLTVLACNEILRRRGVKP